MKYLLYSYIYFFGIFCFAQNKDIKYADQYFNRYEFLDAAKEYKKLIKENKDNLYLYQQLAWCYYNIFDYKEAIIWSQKALEKKEDAELIFRYSQMLKANGNYEEANKQMELFAKLMPNDIRANHFLSNKNYLQSLQAIPLQYEIQLMDLNSDKSDFGAFLSNDKKLYFASARNLDNKNYSWSNEPFLDIYCSILNDKNEFEKPIAIAELNSKYHDGPMSVTADGKTAYFASESFRDNNKYLKIKEKKIKLGPVNLFRASLVDGKWSNIEPLSINDVSYNTSNPSISADGKTLYFSSNRPGSLGETDIWKCSVANDGSLSEPINLGPKINTEARESFPFIAENNVLYFASQGHNGFGGYDVFMVDLNKDSAPVNLGKPINTDKDDFAFTYNTSQKMGFLSSNRADKQVDNIYKIIKKCTSKIEVLVQDSIYQKPIIDALVSVDDEKNPKTDLQTDDAGKAYFVVPCDESRVLKVTKIGFKEVIIKLPPADLTEQKIVVNLPPIQPIITSDEIVLEEIYFEFDKSNITPQGATELNKLLKIMEDYKQLKIAIGSHTDSRGNDAYNMKLSDRRAKTTRQYLISRGIAPDRLTARGYGESMPKVKCTVCTEKQHALNRRSEFKIIAK